jgi:hypothetical protein
MKHLCRSLSGSTSEEGKKEGRVSTSREVRSRWMLEFQKCFHASDSRDEREGNEASGRSFVRPSRHHPPDSCHDIHTQHHDR